jgi:malate-CoA ligase subunit beta
MTQMNLRHPVVVRLAGTNLEEGQRIIKESGLPIIVADDLGEAAEKAVQAANQAA